MLVTMDLVVFFGSILAYSLLWLVLRQHRPFRLPADASSPSYAAERKAAKRAGDWYASTIAAAIATLGSLPFVVDFAATRDLAQIQRRETFSEALLVAFVAYLIWYAQRLLDLPARPALTRKGRRDLIVGTRRRCLTLLAGYCHHIGLVHPSQSRGASKLIYRFRYIVMLSVVLRRGGLNHLFALCCFMELPTFVLGLGFLFPSQRRDDLFLATFAATRLVLHASMIAYLSSGYGRAHAGFPGETTLLPAAMLSASVPLHIWWFATGLAARNRSKRARTVVQAAPCTVATQTPAAAAASPAPPVVVPTPSAAPPIVRPRSPRPMPSSRPAQPRPSFVPIRMRAGFGGMAMIRDRRSVWMRGATARAY